MGTSTEPISLSSDRFDLGNRSSIKVGEKEFSPNQNGWNGVILDPKRKVSRRFFTASSGSEPVQVYPAEEPKVFFERVSQKTEFNIVDVKAPDELRMTVKKTSWKKILKKRDEAFRTGMLFSSSEDFVPAKFKYKGKNYKAKIRLKGDWLDHLRLDRWSFRVKMSGVSTLKGMKIFSIQDPRGRGQMTQWMMNRIWKEFGGISPRIEFVRIFINEKDTGVYLLEEHFEKRLIENHRRREGPIVKFDEDSVWKHYDVFASPKVKFFEAPIKPFRSTTTFKKFNLRENFLNAHALLDRFRKKEASFSDVFDGDLMARFFLMMDVFGQYHGFNWHNVRFYYNPLTARLEPISFDNVGGIRKGIIAFQGDRGDLKSLMFQEQAFLERYFGYLEEYAFTDKLDQLLMKIYPEFLENQSQVRVNTPNYGFKFMALAERREGIRKMLNLKPHLEIYPAESLALSEDLKELNLVVHGSHPQPIQIIGCEYRKNPCSFSKGFEGSKIVFSGPNQEIKLPLSRPIRISRFGDLRIKTRIVGTTIEDTISLRPYVYPRGSRFDRVHLKADQEFRKHPAIIVKEEAKAIYFKPGRWKIERDLLIPKDYTLFARDGTRLELANQANIISYSKIDFRGSDDNPIIISSPDGKGQGLYVLRNEGSVLRNVIFDNLSNLKKPGFGLTGAVTFFKAPVKIFNSQFLNNRSEDGLNIVDSDFEIKDSLFQNTYGDALDVDFGKGSIVNTHFRDLGNDALDFSGSVASIRGVKVYRAGDKGISAGESSVIRGRDISVEDAHICLASKDLSLLKVTNVKIDKCKIFAAAYQKKSEYGGAKMELQKLTQSGTSTFPFLIEKGSSISIDREKIISKQKKKQKVILKRLKQGALIY